jgi:hypothetical protein
VHVLLARDTVRPAGGRADATLTQREEEKPAVWSSCIAGSVLISSAGFTRQTTLVSKAVVAARRMSLESTISLASGLVATKLGTRMLDTFVMKSSKDIVLSSPVIGRPRLRRQTLVNLRFKFVKPLGVLHCLGHWKGNSFGICFGLVGIGLSLKNSSFSDSALLLLLQTESQWIEVTTK